MKRFINESINHFINDYKNNDLMNNNARNDKIKALQRVKMAYKNGLISESECMYVIARIVTPFIE